MTILGIHIDVKIRAIVDIKVEANLFGDNKYDAIRTVEVYKQLTPQHDQLIEYYYTSDMLKASIHEFITNCIRKLKGCLWK